MAPCHKEATVFQGTVHRDNLKAYIPLVTELLTAPRFAPEDFERLRNEALDYVTKTLRGNNDEELGKWTLQCGLYKDHPYGHPDHGTEQGLKAITLDDVKAFHKRYYTREALTLGMAGGFDPAAAAQVESKLASLPFKRGSCRSLATRRRTCRHRGDHRCQARRSNCHLDRLPDRRDPARRRLLRTGGGELVSWRAPHIQRQADAGPARQSAGSTTAITLT